MRADQKQNISLPQLTKSDKLELNNQYFVVKPKFNKIFYSPIITSNRQEKKINIFQAFMKNKNYDDIKDEKKQKQIQQMLRQTNNNFTLKQQRSKSTVGKDAKQRYYKNYKRLDKLISLKKYPKQTPILPYLSHDPSILILQQTQQLGILPSCMGIIKSNRQQNILNINGYKFGDKYIKAISSGIKQIKQIQYCQFSNNRITSHGFNSIINNIGFDVVKLNFSNNSIANVNQKLVELIVANQGRLEYLNLENNLLTDHAVDALCKSATYSKHLKYLNVRKNLLTKQCAQSIADLLLRAINLQQLYIGSNRICEQGALSIFESLQQNRSIKVFDYSMNKLGDSKPSCAKMIGTVLQNNKILIHMDLSNNKFTQQQSKIISQKLVPNKKIYGIHYYGNYGYINSKGFLILQKKDLTSLHSIIQNNINSYNIISRRQPLSYEPTKYKNVCWICQGWYQQIFKFIVPIANNDGKNYVYIHFDFQEYQPRLINIYDTKIKYKTMVPPNQYRYFFTWNQGQYVDQAHYGKEESFVKKVILQIPLQYNYIINNQMVNIKVYEVSCREGKAKKIVNNWDEIIVTVLPREDGLVAKKQKKKWSYKDSIWSKQWRLDTQQLIKNCFEKDWKSSKLCNFIKNQTQQDKIKLILYQNYKLIKQFYKYYSSWVPFNGDIWAISANTFTEFCYLTQIISKDTPLKIIDLIFITTNSISGNDYKGNLLVPERGLIRFQFMEAIVRLAEQKYKKNGIVDSIFGSVVKMMEDNLQPLSNNPICTNEKWRLQKYFSEQNDMLLKKYRIILTQIYKKHSKLRVKPGNKPFMCLTQYKSIIQKIGILGTYILDRDIFIGFNCSMMTQIDQLDNQRFIRMSQIQFIQAVARCAYLLPNHCKVEDIFGNVTPFHAKFQWIIHQLKALCSEDIKSMFPNRVSLFNKSEDDQ